MEHRWSRRVAIARHAVIECARHGAVLARLRNLSLHGAFVFTGAGIALPLYASLTVAFSFPHGRHFRFEAMVVRQERNGAALMFLDPDRAAQQALRAALYETAAEQLAA